MTEAEWLASVDPEAMVHCLTGSAQGHHYFVTPRKLRLFACACCRLVWDKLTDPRSRRAVEVAELFADGLATAAEMQAACDAAQDLPHAIHPIQTFDVGLRAATAASWAAADHSATSGGAQTAASAVLRYLPEFAAAQAALLRAIFGNPWRSVTLRRVVRSAADMSAAALESGASEEEITSPWLTPTVLDLARQVYGGECQRCGGTGLLSSPRPSGAGGQGSVSRFCGCDEGRTPFNAAIMPILADALEDAGCTDETLLRWLRGEESCQTTNFVCPCGCGRSDPCQKCNGTGWRKRSTPSVRGDWAIDLILGKE